MRCSILKDTIPLVDEVVFTIADKKPVVVYLQGVRTKSTDESDPLNDLVGLLSSANVGFKLPNDFEKFGVVAFSYQTSSNWVKQTITLDGKDYYLYQNKLTFGVTKSKLVLSFVVKERTSDSESFYEDLVGKVLTGSDIKALAWLLATGNSITGRRLISLKMSSRLEQVNELSIFNPVLQVMTSNSTNPKTMYLSANDMSSVIDLNTVASVTIRKKLDSINIIFTTKGKVDYTLEFD